MSWPWRVALRCTDMEDGPQEKRSLIIVVEDAADISFGHFSKIFAEQAEGFVDAGCEVVALTAFGWARDQGTHRFTLTRYGLIPALLARKGRWILKGSRKLQSKGKLAGGLSRLLFHSGQYLSTAAALIGVRQLIRRQKLDPFGIVVDSIDVSPRTIDRFAGSQRWMLKRYIWSLPGEGGSGRRRSGQVGLFCPAEGLKAMEGGFPVFAVNLAVSRRRAVNRSAARSALGFGQDERIVAIVGSGHSRQDVETAFEVLRQRDDVTTVVLGRLADRLDASTSARWLRPPVLKGGFVDPEVIDHYLEAADLVVVALTAGFPHCSGVVLDAASAESPVIVSEPSLPANWIMKYRAGETFASGSPASLAAALDRIDLEEARRGVRALRDDMLAVEMARRLLTAFAQLQPSSAT